MAEFTDSTLEVEITTTPAKTLATIEDYFDRAYKGERGNIESKSDFLNRKIEEFIQGIARRMYIEDNTLGMSRSLEKHVTERLQIRQRQDKPEEAINELGENDPSMMPEPKPAPARAQTRKRRR